MIKRRRLTSKIIKVFRNLKVAMDIRKMTKSEIIKEIIRCNRILTVAESYKAKNDFGKYKNKLVKELNWRNKHEVK